MSGLLRKLRGRTDDTARLLDHDAVAERWDELQDDSILPAGPTSAKDLEGAVASAKKTGRALLKSGADMSSTRTGDLVSAAGDTAKAGAMMGADALLPGLGYGLSAADSLHSMHQSHKQGASVMGEGAKQSVSTAAGFIPVVGEFLGFVEGIWDMGVAVFQSDKSRTADKVKKAQKVASDAPNLLSRVGVLREQLAGCEDDATKAELLGRLDKAEARLRKAMAEVEAWQAKKADHATLPLTGEVSTELDGDEAS